MCIQNLYGSCKLGDVCPRKHVELSKLNEEAAKRGNQRKEKTDKEGEIASDKTSGTPNPKEDKKSRVCFQWQANGTCEFGEKCIFNHPTAGQKAKACRIKRPKTPIDLEAGALVMVPHDSRYEPLRGVLGQIIGKGIECRYRVQLDIEFRLRHYIQPIY